MKSYKVIFILGVVLILLPLMGIYSSWKEIIIFAIGVYIAWHSLSLWRRDKQEAIISNKFTQ